VKKAGRVHRPQRPPQYDAYDVRKDRGLIREYGPVVFGGLMLVIAFAFAGHYMGQSAVAHNAYTEAQLDTIAAPASSIVTKGSLLPDGKTFDLVNLDVLRKQAVAEDGKGDIQMTVAAAEPPAAIEPPAQKVNIVPASIDLNEQTGKIIIKRNLSPSTAKIEQSFKLKRADRDAGRDKDKSDRVKIVAQRNVQLAEENCLARAVYFEARSETDLGQLAVAKVILNRVKDPAYPKSICGVVYQGSGSRNTCQFSFACDGLPDDVKQPGAWAHAKMIAEKAIAGDQSVAAIGNATNYHADYVTPRWARNMKRLIKIGHHIFYADT